MKLNESVFQTAKMILDVMDKTIQTAQRNVFKNVEICAWCNVKTPSKNVSVPKITVVYS